MISGGLGMFYKKTAFIVGALGKVAHLILKNHEQWNILVEKKLNLSWLLTEQGTGWKPLLDS